MAGPSRSSHANDANVLTILFLWQMPDDATGGLAGHISEMQPSINLHALVTDIFRMHALNVVSRDIWDSWYHIEGIMRISQRYPHLRSSPWCPRCGIQKYPHDALDVVSQNIPMMPSMWYPKISSWYHRCGFQKYPHDALDVVSKNIPMMPSMWYPKISSWYPRCGIQKYPHDALDVVSKNILMIPSMWYPKISPWCPRCGIQKYPHDALDVVSKNIPMMWYPTGNLWPAIPLHLAIWLWHFTRLWHSTWRWHLTRLWHFLWLWHFTRRGNMTGSCWVFNFPYQVIHGMDNCYPTAEVSELS